MWRRPGAPSFSRSCEAALCAPGFFVCPSGPCSPCHPLARNPPPDSRAAYSRLFCLFKMPMKEFHVVGRKTPTEAVRFVRVAPRARAGGAGRWPPCLRCSPPVPASLPSSRPRSPRRSRSRPSTACGCLRRTRRWQRAATGACQCRRARPPRLGCQRRAAAATAAGLLSRARRYFLHQLYKMKASTGDILAVSEVRERNTATVKNCEWLARSRREAELCAQAPSCDGRKGCRSPPLPAAPPPPHPRHRQPQTACR